MRWGIPLSAAAHAGVIALALWGLPWLRVRPAPPEPVLAVRLVTPAEVAALSGGQPMPETPVAAPVPEEPEPAPIPELPLWQPDPETEADVPELTDLAPAFDAAAPLGLEAPSDLQVQPDAEFGLPVRPRARGAAAPTREAVREVIVDEGAAGADAASAGAPAVQAGFEAAVRDAIARAQIYPRAALDRGITGSLRLGVRMSRDGRLVEARVARSSGSVVLDRAGLDAARRARLPAAPDGLGGSVFDFEVRLSFGFDR